MVSLLLLQIILGELRQLVYNDALNIDVYAKLHSLMVSIKTEVVPEDSSREPSSVSLAHREIHEFQQKPLNCDTAQM